MIIASIFGVIVAVFVSWAGYIAIEARRFERLSVEHMALRRRWTGRGSHEVPPVPIDFSFRSARERLLSMLGLSIPFLPNAIDPASDGVEIARLFLGSAALFGALLIPRFHAAIRAAFTRLRVTLREELSRLHRLAEPVPIGPAQYRADILLSRIAERIEASGPTRAGPPIASGIATAHARRGPPVFAIPRG